MNTPNPAPQVPTDLAANLPGGLPPDLSLTLPTGDTVRHILLGSPGSIRQTIHLLHNLRYVEPSQWSPLIEIPDHRLILTPHPGDVLTILMRRT